MCGIFTRAACSQHTATAHDPLSATVVYVLRKTIPMRVLREGEKTLRKKPFTHMPTRKKRTMKKQNEISRNKKTGLIAHSP